MATVVNMLAVDQDFGGSSHTVDKYF